MTDQELEKRIESYYDGENLFRSLRFMVISNICMFAWIPKSTTETKFAEVVTHQSPEYSWVTIFQEQLFLNSRNFPWCQSWLSFALFISDDLTFAATLALCYQGRNAVEPWPVGSTVLARPLYRDHKFNVDLREKEHLKTGRIKGSKNSNSSTQRCPYLLSSLQQFGTQERNTRLILQF